MRERGERGKGVEEMYNGGEHIQDYTEALPCRRHPYASPVGVCSSCLKERLVSLVCSDCGEPRLSSCSCSSSDISSSITNGGDVGRISFLLENDHGRSTNTIKQEEILSYLLKSNSSSVEIKRRDGFWRIGRLFSKKRSEKGINGERKSSACEETKSTSGSDVWAVDYMGGGVSRSRSLCSFRGGGGGGGGTLFGSEDGSTFSGARSSVSNARSSGFNGGLLFDPDRKSGFSEPEPRRRSGFTTMDDDDDDSGFIDLKFDHLPTNFIIPEVKLGSFGSMRRSGDSHLVGDGFVPHGGSCRKGIKRSRKSFKSWRWIFSHHVPSFKKNNDEAQVV